MTNNKILFYISLAVLLMLNVALGQEVTALETIYADLSTTTTTTGNPTTGDSEALTTGSSTTGSATTTTTTGKASNTGAVVVSGSTDGRVITTGFDFPDPDRKKDPIYTGNPWITASLSVAIFLFVCSCFVALWAMKYKAQQAHKKKQHGPDDLKEVVVTSPSAPAAASATTSTAAKKSSPTTTAPPTTFMPKADLSSPTPSSPNTLAFPEETPASPSSVHSPQSPESPQSRISLDLPSLLMGRQKVRNNTLSDEDVRNGGSSSSSISSANSSRTSSDDSLEKGFEMVEKPRANSNEFDQQTNPAVRI